MPDLVNDPQYEGIDLDRGDPNDPEYWSAERVAKRNKWRDWSAKQRDEAARLTQRGAEQGMDADTTLSKLGFADEKEKGKYIWSLFGNQGLFATQGNVDPNLEYDWGSGRKTWKPGTDNAGQSIPITREEYDSRSQAMNYQKQGLQGYGAHANAEAFKKAVGFGHFTKDPKTGMYYNVGQGDPNDPTTWQWTDQYGRSANGIASGGPKLGHNYATGGGTGQKIGGMPAGGRGTPQGDSGGWLPDQGQGYSFGPPTAQYGGSGNGMPPSSGGYAGGVPDMYAGTKAAVGMPQGGGGLNYGGPTRQQRAQADEEDEKSPYKQLMPQGQSGIVSQPRAQSAQLGGF